MAMKGEWYDPLFRLRYGVGSAEKYAKAVGGQIPGAQPIRSEDDVAREERRASGYLFARQHPSIAPVVQPTVDAIRTYVFRDDPSVVAAASEGMDRALAERPLTLGDIASGARPQPSASPWDNAMAYLFSGRR